MWCDVSHDITPCLMSFLPSEGPDVCSAGGVSDMGVVIRDSTDLSFTTVFVRVVAVHFDMSSTIAEDTLGDLGASLRGMSDPCTLLTMRVFIVWAIFPPVGKVGNAGIEYGQLGIARARQ